MYYIFTLATKQKLRKSQHGASKDSVFEVTPFSDPSKLIIGAFCGNKDTEITYQNLFL